LSHAAALRVALEAAGWDGQWYRRAYYDDGTVLGSSSSHECRIDALAQFWAVLSGAAEPGTALLAMAAVSAQLIDRDTGLALLFTPPFDRSRSDPGYVKAYPPGVRENGGQYTHGALWSIIACAAL
jgi:cyclic beta-1,2-glucan synthetase